jgi:hypothetical protein
MSISKTQVTYAVNRVHGIANSKKEAFASSIPLAKGGLSFTEKVKLIRAGQAKLRPTDELKSYTDLVDAYVFPSDVAHRKATAAREEKIKQFNGKVDAEVCAITDKLMLGDAEEALGLIEAFAKKK